LSKEEVAALTGGGGDISASSGLSQTMHPSLQVPFWFLHPCRTEQFLGDMSRAPADATSEQITPVRVLSAWLGVLEQVFIGPLILKMSGKSIEN
jgi:hypothetical protein